MQMHNCHRSTSPFDTRRWTSTSTSEFDPAPSKQRMNDALKNLSGQISFPPYKLNYSVHLFQCGRSLRPPLLLLFQNKPSIILPQQLLPINVRWITRLAKHGSRTIHPHLILSTRLFLRIFIICFCRTFSVKSYFFYTQRVDILFSVSRSPCFCFQLRRRRTFIRPKQLHC